MISIYLGFIFALSVVSTVLTFGYILYFLLKSKNKC